MQCVLFEQQYNMIDECTRLENLMPSYDKLMHKFGSIIRNKVWKKSNEERLAYLLYCCNNILAVFIDVMGEHAEIAEFYVDLLIKYWKKYSAENMRTNSRLFIR